MNISFEIPQDVERQLRTEGADLNREAKTTGRTTPSRSMKSSGSRFEMTSQ